MAWPTNKPDSNKFSSDNSSIKESRPELNTMSQAVNDIVDYVDTAAEANGYILQYNSGTGKLEYVPNNAAIDINGNNGITVTQPSSGGHDIEFSGTYNAGNITYTFATSQLELLGSGSITPTIKSTSSGTEKGIALSTGGSPVSTLLLEGGTPGNIQIIPSGGGVVYMDSELYLGPLNTNTALYTRGAGNLTIQTNGGVGGGKIEIIQGTNGNISIEPNGTGLIRFHNAYGFPTSDGSAGQVLQTNGAGQLSFATVSGAGGTDTQIVAGTGITVTQPDSGGAWTISATGGGAGITDINAGTNMAVSSPDSAGGVEVAMSSTWNNPINVNDQVLSNAGLKGYSETVYTAGATTGTLTPAVSDGNVQTITLTGNITINALSSPATGDSVTMIIRQPSSGGPYTLSSTMKFAGGTKTLSTTANAIDIIHIFYDGTDYLASLSTNFS